MTATTTATTATATTSTTTTSTTTVTSTPSPLQDATTKSTVAWQSDLEALFHRSKDRFPDVVWAILTEEDDEPTGEQVYGHKAIIYARAPPSFQARYFSFRPAPVLSPGPLDPYSPSGFPTQSALTLSLGPEVSSISRSPSPFRPASPVSQSQDGLMHLTTSINPNLFSKELEYLYTGKGLGATFEFFYDSSDNYREEGDAEESRIDKLRKDLVFMWRSRLYSDVRIGIEGSSSSHHEGLAAIFSTHRFILVSRSDYFHNALIAWNTQRPEIHDDQDEDRSTEPPTLMLPSPPFTPPSLHFVLGFIYTGTLIFSNRTYDLDTAFHIMRSATYISLTSLYDEVQARIVHEMMHGLFHAYVDFAEYERITGGKWGVSGCRCRQCARRIPRVIEFSLLDDVKNELLQRGARRGLVGMFGEGWCNAEFAKLDKKIRDTALKGVAKRTTPLNIFPLLFSAEFALTKLNSIIDPWADISREMILDARRHIDQILCSQADECFSQSEWLELMDSDGVKFEDGDHVEWIIKSIQRGFTEKNAGRLYQALVSSILLRPHASDPNATMLSPTSLIRQKVEATRVELLRWMKKRWIPIRMEGGFDNLDPWALKEIGHELELSNDDLVSPANATMFKSSPARNGVRSTKHLDAEADTVSQHSLRTSLLNRNLARHHAPTSPREPLMSSSSSIRSVARSTHSTTSKFSDISTTQQRRLGPRPDSKLTPSGDAISRSLSRTSSTSTIGEEDQDKSVPIDSTSPAAKRRRPAQESSPVFRPKSPSGSIASVRSRASTVRKHTQSTPTPSLRISSATSRPTSSVSQRSDASSTFKSTNSEFPGELTPRPRRSSVSSTVSTVSVKTTATTTSITAPATSRPRRTSATSITSTNTTSKPKNTVPPLPDSVRLNTRPAQKLPSNTSLRSTASTSPSTLKRIVPRKSAAGKPGDSPKAKTISVSRDTAVMSTGNVKGKGKEPAMTEPVPLSTSKSTSRGVAGSEASASSASILVATRRKESTEAISRTTSASDTPASAQPPSTSPDGVPRGATLQVGIPCIIASKRARFRALARYIGEVEGELGPWVGVEVPMGDTWPGDKLDARAWHDGTWGGVRYFDIGSSTDWDFGDDVRSTMRRKRLDGHGLSTIGKGGGRGLKREGGHLDAAGRQKRFRSVSPAGSDTMAAESRGLFVRPQQVLYVVDAVGSDF